MSEKHSTIVDDTVEHLVQLHRQHERSTSATQRAANSITAAIGRPAALGMIIVLIGGWMFGNGVARRFGVHALEEFPFPDLALVATIAALLTALLILTTQRHQDQLAERRAQLTLQIALLSERKVAKIIGLLEEQRRDNPLLASRTDDEAEDMAKAVDAQDSMRSLDRSV